jgi:hypothetical protein
MREPGIGRVLVASLHQGIADVLPMRLAFYEGWLNHEGLRGGTIGLAPVLAVLSFLRLEGPPYHTVMARAGRCAAEWTVESMSPFERRSLAALPAWLRRRMVLRVGRRLVHESCQTSRAVARVQRGAPSVALDGSIFCTVREPVSHPLCGFYAAAFGQLMTLFDLDVAFVVSSCRGVGAPACLFAGSPAAGAADQTPEEPAA